MAANRGRDRRCRGSRALRRDRARMVGRGRRLSPTPSPQPGADRIYPRPARGAFRPRHQNARALRRAQPARYRLRRRADLRADGAARLRRDRHRRRYDRPNRGARACRGMQGLGIDYRDDDAEDLAARGTAFRCGAGARGRRARRRSGALRRDGGAARKARRRADSLDHQSHAESLRRGDRRRGICAALAAARHA